MILVFIEPQAGVISRYEKVGKEKLKRTHRADAGKALTFNYDFINTFIHTPFTEFSVGEETVGVKKT